MIHGPWGDEINLCNLYVSQTMGLTPCYKAEFFTCLFEAFSTKLCYFHFRISSLTSSEQSDRTLSECSSVVSACQILNKLNHLCGVVISIFKMAAMEFPDSSRITALSESTANLRMYFRL